MKEALTRVPVVDHHLQRCARRLRYKNTASA
jgi:hypothetical protein